jgi:hypothetical protein
MRVRLLLVMYIFIMSSKTCQYFFLFFNFHAFKLCIEFYSPINKPHWEDTVEMKRTKEIFGSDV